ncbi:TnsA endonuclease N-terminal domain-containing protein [Psychrobacillus sp.]|uniref:TnsA endonuclease N-terminal domain-containing protein n=1 Tax=Psychrobacillus sp. TaxID=1871623 RepID=UPI0028BD84D2|nr:TnsA endonuclease N-terminal domain-containing protein [Psychrobacillus sp.]
MSVNKYTWTEEKIARFYKEGRGSGELNHYQPWLKINEVPSRGRSHRPRGWKTNRIHHFLSDLELSYFYYLEWSKKVIDIREQFPLEREDTLKIASDKGIKHSIETTTQTHIVMTTDFLITSRVDNKIIQIARSIKPSSELEDPRVLEKLEIERQYWVDRDIEWSVIDEKVMSTQFVKNMKYIHVYYYLENNQEEEMSLHFLDYLYRELKLNPTKQLITCCSEFDSLYNLEDGSSIYYMRHLYARQYIETYDMEKPIKPHDTNLTDIIFNERSVNKNYGSSIS